MITKTAWKNIWRNKVRSLIVIASVAVGIFAGAFSVAMMEGAMVQRVDDALNNELAHIQITSKDFRENNDLACFMENTDGMKQKAMALDEVRSVADRIVVTGMANTTTKSSGVQINGINPDEETLVLGLYRKLKPGTGNYLDAAGRSNMAYIGEDLAKELNILRYSVTTGVMDSLKARGIPQKIVDKLEPYIDVRFNNEKAFTRELKKTYTKEEETKYGYIIKEGSQTYRQGSRMTLTFLDKDNYQTGALFRIAGIYDISSNIFESSQVFVLKDDLQRLTGLSDGEEHIITIKLNDVGSTQVATDKLKEIFPAMEVLNWREIQPDLAMMEELAEVMYGAFMVIILAALAFGIVNTMLMVVLERTKELGMLAAIGMNRKKIFRMIMSESVFLSLVGGVTGMIVSKIIITITAKHGINFTGYKEGFEAMGYSAHIYPHIGNDFFVIVTFLIIITGILSAIYPAFKALKLDPADALRTE